MQMSKWEKFINITNIQHRCTVLLLKKIPSSLDYLHPHPQSKSYIFNQDGTFYKVVLQTKFIQTSQGNFPRSSFGVLTDSHPLWTSQQWYGMEFIWEVHLSIEPPAFINPGLLCHVKPLRPEHICAGMHCPILLDQFFPIFFEKPRIHVTDH